MWTGSESGPTAGSGENGNEASGSITGGKFLDYLSDYQLLKSQVKVKVTLRLTVSQSVCLGVEIFLLVSKFLSCPCGAPSLTRGRVCHLSES
jgi:hypothetical protein